MACLAQTSSLPASTFPFLFPGWNPLWGKHSWKDGRRGSEKGKRGAGGAAGKMGEAGRRETGDKGAGGKRVRKALSGDEAPERWRSEGGEESSGVGAAEGAAQPGTGGERGGRGGRGGGAHSGWCGKKPWAAARSSRPTAAGAPPCPATSSPSRSWPRSWPGRSRPSPPCAAARRPPGNSWLSLPGTLSGLAAGTAGRGGGPGQGWGCCPGEGPQRGGSPALPALGRAGPGRTGGAFLSFPSLRRRSVRVPATLGQELLAGSWFRLRGPRGVTCLWS